MVNKNKEEKEIAISQAWNILYQRLEKEGLIPDEARRKYRDGLVSIEGSHPDETRRKPRHGFVSTAVRRAIAAAIIAACIFSGWYFWQKTILPDTTMLVLQNEVNAPTLATTLEDGTVVYLSEQTSLQYPEHFANDKREVILQGEAFFEIKRQPDRPFFIDTDQAGVEVTGTAFKIKSDRNTSFLLSVREGEVRVTQKHGLQSLTVNTGETVLFDSDQFLLKKNTDGFDEFFTHIRFKDECLNDVANIINQRLDTLQLKIDPMIGDRTITFTYIDDGNIAETAELICKALDLRLTQHDHTLYISKPE